MSSLRVTFDPAQIPEPENLAQRRRYIEQYIQHFHQELLPEIDSSREEAVFWVSRKYHEQRGKIEAPTVYFEYNVDKTMWRNIFLELGQAAPAWPWTKGPDPEDMSGGMSTRYREWRIKYDLPVPPQIALPTAPQAPPNFHERLQNPMVLDMALRQRFWQASSGGQYTGAIYGPFSLKLPVWLDFERFVVGKDGHDIDAINNEILESGVAVSWEVSSSRTLCLVVGFKDETISMLPQVQQHLFEVWCDIVTWFCCALQGSPVSLASSLRIMQVVNPFMERTPDLENAQRLWQDSLAESDLFASRSRKGQEYFESWSPMIREIIQQPLGVAEKSLAAWIYGEDDSGERTTRLNVARDVWLTSSSDPKVIRRATRWVQSFTVNLQPSH